MKYLGESSVPNSPPRAASLTERQEAAASYHLQLTGVLARRIHDANAELHLLTWPTEPKPWSRRQGSHMGRDAVRTYGAYGAIVHSEFIEAKRKNAPSLRHVWAFHAQKAQNAEPLRRAQKYVFFTRCCWALTKEHFVQRQLIKCSDGNTLHGTDVTKLQIHFYFFSLQQVRQGCVFCIYRK